MAETMIPAREFLCQGCQGSLNFPDGVMIAADVQVWHDECAPEPLPKTRYIIERPRDGGQPGDD